MTSVETNEQALYVEQWRREVERTLPTDPSLAGEPVVDETLDPNQFWRSVFNRCISEPTEHSAFREGQLKLLQSLAIATREAIETEGGRGQPPLIRVAFKKLSELPTHRSNLSAADWAEIAFGLALQALLDAASQADVDSGAHPRSFMLIIAARNAYQLLEGKIADQLLDRKHRDCEMERRQAVRHASKWLRRPDLYNESGWPVLELCMRSLVELIVAYTNLFQRKEGRNARGVADIELETTKECRALIRHSESPVIPDNYPMLVPPNDWKAGRRGGHLQSARQLAKLRRSNAIAADVLHLVDHGNMPRVYSALNILQRTGWRINQRILGVCRQIYHNAPEALLGEEQKKLRFRANRTESTKAKWRATSTTEILESQRVDEKTHSRTVGLDDLAAQQAFYFPYQLDYRGRLYPQATWLTPQGDDLAKGLLEFAIGKPIEATDGDARKFLAAYGSQFVSDKKIIQKLQLSENRIPDFDERLRWIEAHETEIIESATTPLQSDWWLTTPKDNCRWQFLSFCNAWKDMREGKRSHLPVYVDGTCNGLQHMAALLRDRTLAQYTNLLKSNSKQDTYTWILSAVKEKIIAVAADLSAPHQELADWIRQHDLVTRDAAKKVVMLFSYGSDRYKDKLQEYIADYLASQEIPASAWGSLLGALDKARQAERIPYSIRIPEWDCCATDTATDVDKTDDGYNTEEELVQASDEATNDEQKEPDAKRVMPDRVQLDAWCRLIDDTSAFQAVMNSDEGRLLRDFFIDRLAAYLTMHFTPVMKEKLPTAFGLRETLQDWSREVTRATRLPLCWVSPAGFPVIQILSMGVAKVTKDDSDVKGADKNKRHPPETSKKTITIDWAGFETLSKKVPDEMVQHIKFTGLRQIPKDILPNELASKEKQRSAFPPNFIHSLDASHLMLTIIRSTQFGIDAFAAVHDSYATHAVDVPKLSRALRDSFMLMHRAPLLEEYRSWFELLRSSENRPPLNLCTMQGNLLALWRQQWQTSPQAPTKSKPLLGAKLPEVEQRFDIDEIGESDYIFF